MSDIVNIVNISIEVQDQVAATISTVGTQGPQGTAGSATTNASLLTSGTLDDARLSGNVVLTSDMQAALDAYMLSIAVRTTDPGVLNQPWNDGTYYRFSAGPILVWTDANTWIDSNIWTD